LKTRRPRALAIVQAPLGDPVFLGSLLDQPQRRQARVAAAGEDDVVVEREAEARCGLLHLAGHLDVGLGGRGVARGKVVNHDERGGAELERPLHDFARIGRRTLDRVRRARAPRVEVTEIAAAKP
jgi:hypothetical protein